MRSMSMKYLDTRGRSGSGSSESSRLEQREKSFLTRPSIGSPEVQAWSTTDFARGTVSSVHQGTPTRGRYAELVPDPYLCALCGGERYHLVITAEALSSHVGLMRRCSNCNASQKIIESIAAP